MSELRALPDQPALLAATGSDPLVAYEVGPELLAPPLQLGTAVLFRRLTQLGWAGAVLLGPLEDATALVSSAWQSWPGWQGERSITAPAALTPALRNAGVRGLAAWTTMSVRPGELATRPTPSGVRVEIGVDPDVGRAFVAEHHTARWLAPELPGQVWVGIRGERDALVATGLAAFTGSGQTRLSSLAVHRDARRQGLGWALAQALTEFGLSRSDVVVLGVDDDNPIALALYPAMGYRIDHRLVSGVLARPHRGTSSVP